MQGRELIGEAGSFRIWGNWIGRATDGIYKISQTNTAEDNTITITLENSEQVVISNPSSLIEKDDCIIIEFASEVIFQWYYYGKEKSKENLYYFKFKNAKNEIKTASNVDWYEPKFKTEHKMNAVEFWFYNKN